MHERQSLLLLFRQETVRFWRATDNCILSLTFRLVLVNLGCNITHCLFVFSPWSCYTSTCSLSQSFLVAHILVILRWVKKKFPNHFKQLNFLTIHFSAHSIFSFFFTINKWPSGHLQSICISHFKDNLEIFLIKKIF